MNNSIQLELSSILHVPLQTYEQRFTFFVNNEEFCTNRLVADLLSPKISKQHFSDPTISEYTVNTRHPGNFRKILDLVQFETQTITQEEIPFFIEILEDFENTSKYLTIKIAGEEKGEENDDISSTIKHLQKKLEFPFFYESKIDKEIEKISSHFYEINKEDKKVLQSFSYNTLESILSCPNLRVGIEDDVVEFINELYLNDSKFSSLYAYVYFKNVSSNAMKSFVENVSIDDITCETWKLLTDRLCEEIKENKKDNDRYVISEIHQKKKKTKSFKKILYENQNFNGLINFLKKESNIREEINITCSSIGTGGTQDPWSNFIQ